MLRFVEPMRRQAIEVFTQSHKIKLTGRFLKKQLVLEDPKDCYNCMKAYGFQPDAESCNVALDGSKPDVGRLARDVWTTEIQKFRQ